MGSETGMVLIYIPHCTHISLRDLSPATNQKCNTGAFRILPGMYALSLLALRLLGIHIRQSSHACVTTTYYNSNI